MSGDDPRDRSVRPTDEAEATLTVEAVLQLLERAAKGARELDENLKRVFELSENQASLRLK